MPATPATRAPFDQTGLPPSVIVAFSRPATGTETVAWVFVGTAVRSVKLPAARSHSTSIRQCTVSPELSPYEEAVIRLDKRK
jgi:hypothetical protein